MSIENVSDLTVKAAIKELPGLSDEELDALYDAELDGKGRKSLLDAITSRETTFERRRIRPPRARHSAGEFGGCRE